MTTEMVKIKRRVELLEAIMPGGTAYDKSKRLGITTGQFYAEVRDHGIAHDAQHDARIEADLKALALLAARGFTSAEIAPILQRRRLWVQTTAKKNGIKLQHGCVVDRPHRRDLLAIVSGRTNERVARALSVSISTLWGWMKDEGIDMRERKEFAREHWGQDVTEVELELVAEPAPDVVFDVPIDHATNVSAKTMGFSPAAVARYEARFNGK